MQVKLRIVDLELSEDPEIVRRFFQAIGGLSYALTNLADYGIIHGEDHSFVIYINPFKIWVWVGYLMDGKPQGEDLTNVSIKWDHEGLGEMTQLASTVIERLQQLGVLEVAI